MKTTLHHIICSSPSLKSAYVERTMMQLICAVTLVCSPILLGAQFTQFNIDIPAKSGVKTVVPAEMSVVIGNEFLMPSIYGSVGFSVSAAENLHLQIQFDAYYTQNNDKNLLFPLKTEFSYRNDGGSKPPGRKVEKAQMVNFPISNSGRLIANMNNRPQLLYAFVYLKTFAELYESRNISYTGIIHFKIEYN